MGKLRELFNEEVKQRCETDLQFLFESSDPAYIKWLENRLYTEEEVEKLLNIQIGNCYVAVLSKCGDVDVASATSGAPEPSGGKWRKK